MTNKSFSDLTKINVPFGELDIETKLALHRAHYEGKEIENRGGRMNWVSVRTPSWFDDGAYRVKPEPLRDIAPPWHVMNPDIKWVARDGNGRVYGYKNRPMTYGYEPVWSVTSIGDSCNRLDDLLTFDYGNKPWNESLVQRPVKDEDLI